MAEFTATASEKLMNLCQGRPTVSRKCVPSLVSPVFPLLKCSGSLSPVQRFDVRTVFSNAAS